MSKPSDAPDAKLLSRAKEGDTDAFGALYERYADDIFRFLYAQLSNRMDAEDLTEEVFLRAWKSLPKYRERGFPFSAFLYRIARNALVDHYREASRVKSVPVYEGLLEADELEAEPHKILSANLERQALQRALEGLRADYRQVLVLRFINELSPSEVAEIMDRSEGAVRILQHRALKSLRESFG